jgi:CBS domain containing-hemolysin-like protein
MEWIADPTAWVGLVTLVLLEVVLGIDNLIFIAILSEKLPAGQRDRARVTGLSLALFMRLALLASISWVMSLTTPLFSLWTADFSWRDLILISGGLFLLIKATTEIHERFDAQSGMHAPKSAQASFWPIVAQIVVLDAVFSLDSVITAVGMVDELYVMMAAVVVAVLVMLVASKPLTAFISARPSLVILALGFLLMIGLVLVVDGFGIHVPKGYVYAAIGFSVLIEMLNQLGERRRRARVAGLSPRQRVADAVLRLLGGVPLQSPALAGADGALVAQDGVFAPEEKRMVRGVLGLSQRPVTAIMTPRPDVDWLDASADREALLRRVRDSPYREFPVARGSIDAVEGVVRKEDILGVCLSGERFEIAGLARPVVSVPGTASVLDALKLFKDAPVELALVLDEYGAFQGVVTRTDLLEAIAGDLPDAHGAGSGISPLADGSLRLSGGAPIDDVQERLRLARLPEGDFNTAAGFALALFGRIPRAGDAVEWEGWRLEVAAVAENRIRALVARRVQANT